MASLEGNADPAGVDGDKLLPYEVFAPSVLVLDAIAELAAGIDEAPEDEGDADPYDGNGMTPLAEAEDRVGTIGAGGACGPDGSAEVLIPSVWVVVGVGVAVAPGPVTEVMGPS